MKKSILNIGKALDKAEQKEVNGGKAIWCGYCNCGPLTGLVYGCGSGPIAACPDICNDNT
ncbi:MAG: hypothetical protein JXR05_07515 [Flavobacteriaceae bacterium]